MTRQKSENTQKIFGLSATQRIKSPHEFRLVRQQGKRIRTPHLTSNVIASSVHPEIGVTARIGISVSKRQVRQAVQRNAIKRLIREFFRLHQHELPKIDLSVAVSTPVASGAINAANKATLRSELNQVLRKAALVVS